jgi:hypothetical protein
MADAGAGAGAGAGDWGGVGGVRLAEMIGAATAAAADVLNLKGGGAGAGAGAKLGGVAEAFKAKFGGKKTTGEGGEGKKQKTRQVSDAVKKFLGWLVAVGKQIGVIVTEHAPRLWRGMWAMLCIALVVLVMCLIAYLVYVLNPRVPWFTHAEDLEAYMKPYLADLQECMQTISGARRTAASGWLDAVPSAAGGMHALFDAVDAVYLNTTVTRSDGGTQESLEDRLLWYFQMHNTLKSGGVNIFGIMKADITGNSKQFVLTQGDGIGEPDTAAFVTELMGPLDKLADMLPDVSDALAAAPHMGDISVSALAAGGAWGAEQVALLTAVHKLRTMLDQRQTLWDMWMTRRKFTNAIWTVYYFPFVVDVFEHQIPVYWKHFPKRFDEDIQKVMTGWLWLGELIAELPCASAYTDRDERAQKCKVGDTFVGAKEAPVAQAQAQQGEVVENLDMGAIGKMIKLIVTFFINVGTVMTAIGDILASFATDPLGTIFRIISIFLGTIIGVVLMINYTILSILLLPVIWGFLYSWTKNMGLGIVVTVQLTLYSVAIAGPYALMWLADFALGGVITRMLRCENAPDSWYQRAGFADGNEYTRRFPICICPCGARYATWASWLCSRLPGYRPSHCPQQQIARIAMHRGKVPTDGPLTLGDLHPDAAFRRKPSVEKRDFLLAMYRDKMTWYQKCYAALDGYDYLTRHVCNNFTFMAGLEDPKTQAALAEVCNECFCQFDKDYDNDDDDAHAWMTTSTDDESKVKYQSRNGHDNRHACSRISGVLNPVDPPPPPPAGPELLRKVLMLSVVAVCVMLTLHTMIETDIVV